MKKALLLVLLLCSMSFFAACANDGTGDVEIDTSVPSVGLEFVSNGDGTCSVAGIGTCWDTFLVIPSTSPEGDRVTKISATAFAGNNRLTGIFLPEGIVCIEEYAFDTCEKLSSIVIPESVLSIGDCAFQMCLALTEIRIPSGVVSLGDFAFSCCCNLATVTFAENSKCTDIGIKAFYCCGYLESINLPSGVTTIQADAFFMCDSLKEITIPASVTCVGQAFWHCASLEKVTFAEGSKCTGFVTFSRCNNLESITLPSGITGISLDGCESLKNITFGGTKAEWGEITKGSGWNSYTGNYTVHCTDGDIAK